MSGHDKDQRHAEPIDVYTRAQAIAEGALVDVSEVAREAGIRFPVAVTRAVWEDCVAWDAADSARKGVPQDEAGRLWDLVWMARHAITQAAGSRTAVELYRVPRTGRGTQPRLVRLVAVCGPGDAGEQVITVMQPDED